MKPTVTMIEDAFKGFVRTQAEISAAKKMVAVLEKEQAVYEGILQEGIKPNETKFGITHKRTVGKSVSYAKALEKIREKLIPKSREEATELILLEFTKETFRDNFEKA